MFEVELDVVGHEQVQESIAVVVEKSATRAEANGIAMEPRLFGDIGKSPVPIVPVQLVLPVVGAKQIFMPVVVVVADTHAVGPAGVLQPCLFGDIGEGAIPVVLVQPVRSACGYAVQAPASDDENIHPPVVVVVKEGATSSHRFNNVHVFGKAPVNRGSSEARFGGNIDKS